jgi:hypothetical protein
VRATAAPAGVNVYNKCYRRLKDIDDHMLPLECMIFYF